VPPEALPLRWARAHNVPVLSEIEIAYIFSPSRKILAVSGTNGKTTTVSLADALLAQAGLPHVLCGNIGNPFIGELGRITPDTWVVLEVSSFQLEYLRDFRPLAGVMLNVTPDHFDRYPGMPEYAAAKELLFARQTKDDWAVLNADDEYCRRMAESVRSRVMWFGPGDGPGVRYRDGRIFAEGRGEVFTVSEARLYGAGNIQNMMAVTALAILSGAETAALQRTFREFTPLPHRVEKVRTINGITFVNDSKSTNADSVRKALEGLPAGRAVLIMGGKDKGFSFEELGPIVREKVKVLITLGETRERLARELGPTGVRMESVGSLEEAAAVGYRRASAGDTVLLSPGCSSFDMFANYKERGDVFKRAVAALL